MNGLVQPALVHGTVHPVVVKIFKDHEDGDLVGDSRPVTRILRKPGVADGGSSLSDPQPNQIVLHQLH